MSSDTDTVYEKQKQKCKWIVHLEARDIIKWVMFCYTWTSFWDFQDLQHTEVYSEIYTYNSKLCLFSFSQCLDNVWMLFLSFSPMCLWKINKTAVSWLPSIFWQCYVFNEIFWKAFWDVLFWLAAFASIFNERTCGNNICLTVTHYGEWKNCKWFCFPCPDEQIPSFLEQILSPNGLGIEESKHVDCH